MTLNETLDIYSAISGQKVSIEKSKIYLSSSLQTQIAHRLLQHWNILRGYLLFYYLGVPLFKGSLRHCHLQKIADKIKDKLRSWAGSILSKVGRLVLIKSVIESSFVHSFWIYK